MTEPGRASWTFAPTGAVAGGLSAIAFAGIHHLTIGPIWFFLTPMVVAGAICGLGLAVTYGVLVQPVRLRTWFLYNATFVGLFVALAIVSTIVYEPVTTIQALLALSGPPERLFREAMPLSVTFTAVAAVLIAVLFGRRAWHVVPALLTMAPLTLFLGLNVSIFGLVEIPRSAVYVVVLNFGLIAALAATYAVVFVLLERRAFRREPVAIGSGVGDPGGLRAAPRRARPG